MEADMTAKYSQETVRELLGEGIPYLDIAPAKILKGCHHRFQSDIL
jgi:hypothetical protein